ncbi:MAG: GGDEF domain-containing protein [Lachnospiraceae bacterium]|nr:GGDEF domain-containing protein [Lachnospiraceae bacterium]
MNYDIRKAALIAICFAVLIMFFSMMTADNADKQVYHEYKELGDGWMYSFDGESKPVSLPYAFSNPDRKDFKISRTFHTDMPDIAHDLYLVSYYCNFDIYLDGELYYRCDKRSRQVPGMVYVIVDLPEKLAGTTITIEYKPHLDIGKFRITVPYLGDKGDIVRRLFIDNMFDTAFLLIITVVGAFLVMIGAFIRFNVKYMNINILSTGLFSLFSGTYMMARIEWVRVLFDIDYILYLIEFNSLMVLMLPVLMLLMSVFTGTSKVIVNVLLHFNILNILAEETLSLLNIRSLREMLPFNHIVLIITTAAFLYCLYARREIIDEYKFEITVSIIPLVVFSALDVGMHYLRANIRSGMLLKIGIIFFLCFELFFILKKYNKVNRELQRYDLYREMALTDMATGLSNRNAYERLCKRLEASKNDYDNICCAVFDLNSLKMTNDTLGHAAGDELICALAGVLKDIFKDCGNIFRTGGDEFIVIMLNENETVFNERIEKVSSASDSIRLAGNIKIDYSFGAASYSEGVYPCIADMVKEADNRMYADKKRHHEANNRKQIMS